MGDMSTTPTANPRAPMNRWVRILIAVIVLAIGLLVVRQVSHLRQDEQAASAPKPNSGAKSTATSNNNEYVEYQSKTQQWGPMISTWTVPPKPAVNNGQFIAFWPAFNSSVSVLQPVLAWESSDEQWKIASWDCCHKKPYNSTRIIVNDGDAIMGTITPQCELGEIDCQDWTITTTNVTTGESSTFDTTTDEESLKSLMPAFLETQTQTSCDDLPANTGVTFITHAFDNNEEEINPEWVSTHDAHDRSGPVEGLDCDWSQDVSGSEFTLGYDSGSEEVPNFLLTGSPAQLSLEPGSSVSFPVNLVSQYGFSGSATLDIYGLPDGVTATFSEDPITTDSTVTLTASPEATTGTAYIAVHGTSSDSLHAAEPMMLTVE